jgi:hypothetical protein
MSFPKGSQGHNKRKADKDEEQGGRTGKEVCGFMYHKSMSTISGEDRNAGLS